MLCLHVCVCKSRHAPRPPATVKAFTLWFSVHPVVREQEDAVLREHVMRKGSDWKTVAAALERCVSQLVVLARMHERARANLHSCCFCVAGPRSSAASAGSMFWTRPSSVRSGRRRKWRSCFKRRRSWETNGLLAVFAQPAAVTAGVVRCEWSLPAHARVNEPNVRDTCAVPLVQRRFTSYVYA